MNIIILDSEDEIAQRAADIVSRQLSSKPDSVLGLSVSASSVKMYRELEVRYRRGELSFAEAKAFNLDEYVGLKKTDSRSYSYYLQSRFFNQIDISESNTHSLNCVKDTNMENLGFDYEEKIDTNGGIDLQILGLGTDGHIGFNNPGGTFSSRTRVVKLARSALDKTPLAHRSMGLAATMGLRTIREATHIVLLASGSHKAAAIRNALECEMDISCPASCLQLHHNVTVLIDEAAAQELTLKNDYDQRFRNQARFLDYLKSYDDPKLAILEEKEPQILNPDSGFLH